MNKKPSNTVLPDVLETETKVLLVDDDLSLLRLHQIMLEKFLAPARVTPVDNALEAMLCIEREIPDLVIVDLNMPGIDGFSLLKLLETDQRYRSVAKIILSGMTAEDVGQHGALPKGVMRLQKPLDVRKMGKIHAHLATFNKSKQEASVKMENTALTVTADVSAEAVELPKKKILIIDDNQDIRRLLSISLNPFYEVFEAADGESGLSAFYLYRPSLVFLDIMLPGNLNGLQVLEMIRADPPYRDTRVAMITARGQKTDYIAGQAYGADAYFVKPLSPQKLLHWCHKYIAA
ncbi:MAG: hypothetical protein RLZZ371_1557 [Pseudomonadota bacterium]|jgi:CheY-like chemotaxis protein